MNNELITRAMEHKNRVEQLSGIVDKCNIAIEEIDHGANVIIGGNRCNVRLSNCHLDDGQETLMQQLLISILRNRMEEAEAELELLLPKEGGN